MGKRRKTRQEKIIAELRRKLAVTKKAEQEVGSGPPASLSADKAGEAGKIEAGPGSEKLEIPKISHIARQYPASSISFPTSYGEATSSAYGKATSSAYLKKDLTKTLLLAILAISLELVLYFILG